MQKTKYINFRVLFYSFIAFCLGIVFSKQIFCLDIIYCVFLSLIVFGLLGLCIYFKCIKRFFILFVALCCGFGWYFVGVKIYQGKIYDESVYTISARVKSADNTDSSQSYILHNVVVNGRKESFDLYLKITSPTKLADVGDVLTFDSKIESINLYSLKDINTYFYKNGVSHKVYAKFDDIDVSAGGLTLTEILKSNVKALLKEYMSEDSAEFAYSSLFNDKTTLGAEIKNSFRLSGISHMIATSGLHVGFIVAMLGFLLKKLKTNRYVKAALYVAVLLLYAYICGFSPSITRAVIMFGVLCFADAIGVKKDNLTTLAIAGFVILLFKPLYIFDAGFLLSFFSVLFIYLWQKPIEKFLLKIKLPKKLAAIMSVTIGVQAGLVLIMAMFYEEFSLLSVITNLITVPVFEIGFILVAVLSLLVAVLPFLGFLMYIPDLIFHFIISVSNFIASIEALIIPLFKVTLISCIGIYASIFICSRFVMIKPKAKIISSLCILFMCFVLSMFSALQTTMPTGTNVVLNTYSHTYIFEYENSSYLISDATSDSDIIKIQKYLINYNIYKIDYSLCLNETIAKNLVKYSNNIIIFQKEILSENEEKSLNEFKINIKNTNLIIKNYNKTENIGKLNVILLQENSKNYGLFIENNNTFYSLKNTFTNSQIININNNYSYQINFYFGGAEYFLIDNQSVKTAVLDSSQIYSNNILQKTVKGDWTFTLNYDTINNIRSI